MPIQPSERDHSIDQFRGLTIMAMVVANFVNDVEIIPAWIRHAREDGLGVIDFIAPMFVFAIGLTYGPSLHRRVARDGWASSLGHFIRRAMLLVGIGCILGAGEIVVGVNDGDFNWGVLQSLGVSILLTLPVLTLRPLWRFSIGLTLLCGYQVLLDRFWAEAVTNAPHAGLQGSLGWAAAMMIATALADVFRISSISRALAPASSTILVVAGIALAMVVPIAMMRVTVSYVLITIGSAGLIYAATTLIVDEWGRKLELLSSWGRNALLLFVIHEFLLALFILPPFPVWHEGAPIWLVVPQALFLLTVLSLIARALDRRGWYFTA